MKTTAIPREAADGHGGEAVRYRVEEAHAGEPIGRCAQHGQAEVDVPQRLGSLGDSRRELVVLHRPGGLGSIKLHAADAEHGQDGDSEHDDPHAAEPLELLAVEEDCGRRRVEPRDHGSTRGGEARDGFEDGVRHRELRHVGEQQGCAAAQTEGEPEHDHDDEAVAQAQLSFHTPHRQPQCEPGQQYQEKGGDEGRRGAVVVPPRNGERWQHGEAE